MTGVETRAATPRAEPRSRLRYRPYLDGLRCVAVYLVVAFHADLPGFAGGFVGVDVFFVLSGYLVTRILLRELARHDRVDLRHFYARRFRRILPAAMVTLLVSAFVYAIVATPFEGAQAASGYRSAFWYFANWHFFAQSTDYFAPSVGASPVLHFWSLAVEEQFYLTWPVALAGLYLLARAAGTWRWWVLRAIVAAIVVASAAGALHFGATNLERAYYGTDTRIYQLLTGALLALTPQLVSSARGLGAAARWAAFGALGALLLLGSSAWTMSPITRGIAVVGFTALLIVALERASGGGAGRVLSHPAVAYLGRISYGTYLWHWPIVVVITHKLDPGAPALFAISAGLSTVLAAISFHVLEHPIRVSSVLGALDRRVIAVALAFSLAAGLLVAPALRALTGTQPDIGKLSIFEPGLHTGSIELLDWVKASDDIPRSPDCRAGAPTACVVVHGRGKRVLLMGDSVARMWIPALAEIARREGYTLAVATSPGCPWWVPEKGSTAHNTCAERRAYWFGHLVPEFDPDIVFVAHRAVDVPGNPFWVTAPKAGPTDYRIYDNEKSGAVRGDSPAGERVVRQEAARSFDALRRAGRKLVILEPTPIPADASFDPLNCVSTGSTDCRFSVSTGATPAVLSFRALARQPGTWSLDLDRLACPRLPTCDPVVNDIIVRRDHTHLTGTYALAMADALDGLLHRQGILPPS